MPRGRAAWEPACREPACRRGQPSLKVADARGGWPCFLCSMAGLRLSCQLHTVLAARAVARSSHRARAHAAHPTAGPALQLPRFQHSILALGGAAPSCARARRLPPTCLLSTTTLEIALGLPRSMTSQGLITALVCMQVAGLPSTTRAAPRAADWAGEERVVRPLLRRALGTAAVQGEKL